MTEEYDATLYFEDVEVGDEGPEVVVEELSVDDFVRDAGASCDFNPMHYHESYAKEAGSPDVFGQGMFTAGFAAHMVSDWLGLANVTRFKVRMTAQVWPGDTVTVTGEVTDKRAEDDESLVSVEFTPVNQDDEPVMTGDADATLPSRSS